MKSVLFTQCLQNDFIKPVPPGSSLPNHLHIGYAEALRLVQSRDQVGNIFLFLDNFYRKRTPAQHAVHIRDWHSRDDVMQTDHLSHFGLHCIAGTEGAKFIDQLDRLQPLTQGDDVINSTTLNDFINTDLQVKLTARGIQASDYWHAVIIGVWTDVKVQYLAYDLISRYPNIRIAVCSSLCASRSRIRHQWALDSMKNNLNVCVVDSINELLEFLGVTLAINHHFAGFRNNHLNISSDAEISEEQGQIIRYLFRDSSAVNLKKLGGGFSGAKVFAAFSVDLNGKTEVPQVLKIDSNPKIGKERSAVESIENLLGPSSPRIKEFIHMENLGGIRYFFANMNNTKTTTLQSILKKLIAGSESRDEKNAGIERLLSEINGQLFSRLYQQAVVDRLNLFSYYDYRPAYAEGSLSLIGKLLEIGIGDAEEISFRIVNNESITVMNPKKLYGNISAFLGLPPKEVCMTWVHGDLNLANLLSDEKNNFWMIDFYHTRIGHLMHDFAKMENDIKFILNPVTDAASFYRAFQMDCYLNKAEFQISREGIPGDLVNDPALNIILNLRKLMLDYLGKAYDFTEYRIALLRYSAHSMLFDECNDLQKRLAACSTVFLAQDIYKAYENDIDNH